MVIGRNFVTWALFYKQVVDETNSADGGRACWQVIFFSVICSLGVRVRHRHLMRTFNLCERIQYRQPNNQTNKHNNQPPIYASKAKQTAMKNERTSKRDQVVLPNPTNAALPLYIIARCLDCVRCVLCSARRDRWGVQDCGGIFRGAQHGRRQVGPIQRLLSTGEL